MAGDPPDADALRPGLTVRIVQGDQDVRSTEREPIVGEISRILGADPEGPEVELESGAVGHVLGVEPDV